ncbi:outer membrane protein assembly factor BamA [Acidimangrovimonas sediminis]|uniref:outer membrane protein assembly factor BamA n=1 Tax=Acidimangrovimonas sediminis TaxID=2056283 RepID=UPI001E5F05B0|nr:outer membrane protein assembly factor BamA [Acidimangrovimonas sediminis]
MSLFLATTSGSAILVSAPAAMAQAYRFTSVKVEGNQNIETGTILSYLKLKRGQTVSAADLNDAYQRIAGTGLFQNVTLTPSGSTLIIKVTEYPTIGQIAFQGNSRFKDDELKKIIKSVAHRVYSPTQAESDAATLGEFYRAKGRYAAIVTPRVIKRPDNRVDLVFEIQEGKTTEVQRLSFVGNRSFSDRRLRQVLATKQAGILHQFIQSDSYLRERISEDRQKLTQFYQRRGFIDFQILDVASELKGNRSGFFLTFTVQEGQQYKFGNISVSSNVEGLDAAPYRKLVEAQQGKLYSPVPIKDTIEKIENQIAQQGINFISVDPKVTRHNADGTLDVNFTLVKRARVFVQRIDIEGNTTTLDRVIRRQFHTAEGDPFDPRRIQAAADRVRALDYFSDVQVTTKPGSSPDKVIVDVNVKEKPTGSLTFGVSYNIDSGIGAAISFGESNFLGRGQKLNFTLNTGVDNASSSISFTEPFLLGRNVAFGFDAFYTRQSYDNTYYDSRSVGLQPSLTFPISNNGRLELRYRVSSDRMNNIDSDATTASSVLKSEEGTKTSSSLGYTYSFDSRRTGLDPNDGVVFKFGQDFAGFGGDTKYIKTSAMTGAQTRIWNDEVTLRATLEGGVLSMLDEQSSRAVDRYSGASKIRGFKAWGIGPRDLSASNQDALGGNKYVSLRLESEFPIGLPEEYGITGGLFWDFGSVWGLNSSEYNMLDAASQDTAKFHLRSAVGFSIFWTTPIGPLRFNFSKAIKKESYDQPRSFDLTISTKF